MIKHVKTASKRLNNYHKRELGKYYTGPQISIGNSTCHQRVKLIVNSCNVHIIKNLCNVYKIFGLQTAGTVLKFDMRI